MNTIRPKLQAFYTSLSDDQKARFLPGLISALLGKTSRWEWKTSRAGNVLQLPSPQQRLRARLVARKIIKKYCPKTSNPY